MTKLQCPSCGSNKVKTQIEKESRKLTLGDEFYYDIPVHICGDCEEEGDFNNEPDLVRASSIGAAKKELAVKLIDEIMDKGLSLSYIERAFELPQRTLSSKWRNGISAPGLALLRVVHSMPWVVHVADNKFTKKAIGDEITRILSSQGVKFETVEGDHSNVKITKTVPKKFIEIEALDAELMTA